MQKLYSAANLQEAYLILHLLEHAGIEARIFNEHAQGGLGEIPFTHTYPEVWLINESDQARARELLEEYQNADEATEAVRCPACGEQNPGVFEICWRCSAPIR
ncbi:MAG: DUF2007 domain-containing protein [Gammaproteobacteria bacterium]|nr:MAG: DUF2007 domain-containing protein [Gammaproteobacteria bacterium]